MKPFLPLYQGRPGNLAGFFARGSDENLIVLNLPGSDEDFSGMDVIFHEYAGIMSLTNFWVVGTPRCGVPVRQDGTSVKNARFSVA